MTQNFDRFKFRYFYLRMHYVTNEELCAAINNVGEGFGAILMQSTGLKDKNGKLIYEGDVLEVDCGEIRFAKVLFCEESAMYMLESGDKERIEIHFYCSAEDFRVVGNIYQNPELINK